MGTDRAGRAGYCKFELEKMALFAMPCWDYGSTQERGEDVSAPFQAGLVAHYEKRCATLVGTMPYLHSVQKNATKDAGSSRHPDGQRLLGGSYD